MNIRINEIISKNKLIEIDRIISDISESDSLSRAALSLLSRMYLPDRAPSSSKIHSLFERILLCLRNFYKSDHRCRNNLLLCRFHKRIYFFGFCKPFRNSRRYCIFSCNHPLKNVIGNSLPVLSMFRGVNNFFPVSTVFRSFCYHPSPFNDLPGFPLFC